MFSFSIMAAPTTLDCQSSSNFEANLSELEKVTEVVADCPAPDAVSYAKVCSYSKEKKKLPAGTASELTFLFEQELLKMSCAIEGKDSPEIIKQKTNAMWNKYRTNFACDTLGFNVPNGNILKSNISSNFPDFIYLLIDTYE
ncbi:MAG: hypothetical protein H0V66_07800, partial [Bdellovibrionales bacterium]|nr:hypothetical protein [Bdellovibrionales bacterium]